MTLQQDVAMDGQGLRAARRALDMRQSDLAELLGLTPPFIGMMERGQKPIEPRTARAVRQLANEGLPIYEARWLDDPDGNDIPLADAVIYWGPDNESFPPVLVTGRDGPQPYNHSYGSDSAGWDVLDTPGRLLRLFTRFHEMTVVHGLAPQQIHSAMLVIPEYRQSIEASALPLEYSLRPD